LLHTLHRKLWVDIAKGLGILAVVLGHSGDPTTHHYLFWFHMPLFFYLSGYLFKPLQNRSQFLPWLKKRTFQLLVPYLSFLFTITLVRYVVKIWTGDFNLKWIVVDFLRIIYGGEVMGAIYGSFWFITCLFVTQVLFVVILLTVRQRSVQVLCLLLAFLTAHIEVWSGLGTSIRFPWGIDIALLTLLYYGLGYFSRSSLEKILQYRPLTLSLFAAASALVGLDLVGFLDYELDLKLHVYHNLLLDVLIPLLLTLIVCKIASMFSAERIGQWLASLGASSLPIVYLHIPINWWITGTWFDHPLVFTLIGILFPFALTKLILEKSSFLTMLFLGSQKTQAPR
jgi:fucose 4-O-acetylase-like acetyltransferase